MLDAVRERAVGLGYSAGWGIIKSMPKGVTERAFRAAADAATVRNGGGVQQLRKNLRRVVGPAMSELGMDALVGDALRSYSRYWLETFRLEGMDHRHLADVTRQNLVGHEHLLAARERGHGVICALPHSGNWDAAGIWLVDEHGPFTTVAERLKPASLFDRFVAYRESIGMEVVALTGGERSATDLLTERLRGNGIICLLADRDLSRNGIEVSFFGEAAKMPAGPALLAATTGAALVSTHLYYTDDGWGITFDPEVEVPADGHLRDRVTVATQRMADQFARNIARHPADWHMLQRLWLADLTPR